MEALQSNLGVGGTLLRHSCNITEGINNCSYVFPEGYWFNLVYGTAVLLFCLAVCLIGAGKYHRGNMYLTNVMCYYVWLRMRKSVTRSLSGHNYIYVV